MTALKAHEVGRFVKSPDQETGLFLAYGADAGLVREIGDALIARLAGSPPDPMAHLSLHGDDLATAPGRLADEARAPSLFGGRRSIRVRAATKALAPVVADLIAEPLDCVLVLEAGNLAKDDALRRLAETHVRARALPCYADSDKNLVELIETGFREAGITASADAVGLLRSLLGNDREITRREIEKLCLYALKSRRIELADVEALCGDNSARAIDAIVDAAGSGDATALDAAFAAALASGIEPQRILSVALGHFLALRRLRRLVDGGETPKQALESARPRLHFSRLPVMERQLRLWSDRALAEAALRLYDAILETRRHASIRAAATGRALLAVCIAGAQR